jgi:hypothetical protein
LADDESLAGHTLVIGIDGGRMRERRKKPGAKKKGQKRQGYYTPWREPKLFTLYLLDAQGQRVEEFVPLHDATLGNHHQIFAILQQYLVALNLKDVARIVFCADGAPWIWSGVEALCQQMGWSDEMVYQVLDYPHAQQNLQEIIDLLPAKTSGKSKLERQWKTLLWQGDIQGLRQEICRRLKGPKKKQGLKKWQSYFAPNEKRMCYETFKEKHIPQGSGCVESAIRRVINLRLKSAGSFWTAEILTMHHPVFGPDTVRHLLIPSRLFQRRPELATKQLGQGPDVYQKSLARRKPTLTVRRQPSPRHQKMEMGMITHIPGPGLQYPHQPDLPAHKTLIPGQLL